jgi:hypothetical protein
MRTITTHHTNECNKAITLHADERNPDNGNASHEYRAQYMRLPRPGWGEGEWPIHAEQALSFQNGPIGEVGINGLTLEVLYAIQIDRLEGFQSSKWACEQNAIALEHTRAALAALESRTKARTERGVEGTHEV